MLAMGGGEGGMVDGWAGQVVVVDARKTEKKMQDGSRKMKIEIDDKGWKMWIRKRRARLVGWLDFYCLLLYMRCMLPHGTNPPPTLYSRPLKIFSLSHLWPLLCFSFLVCVCALLGRVIIEALLECCYLGAWGRTGKVGGEGM